jgi:hypothetical protein
MPQNFKDVMPNQKEKELGEAEIGERGKKEQRSHLACRCMGGRKPPRPLLTNGKGGGRGRI